MDSISDGNKLSEELSEQALTELATIIHELLKRDDSKEEK